MSALSITVAGAAQQVEAGTTAADLFAEDREIVVARINGKLVDLSTELTDGDTVEPVSIHEEDGLNVLRHSAAHVMAQAVQEYRKDAKLGIGPYITDGFYFDFDVEEPFTPEDLKKIEKNMVKIIKSGQTFRRPRLRPRWRTSPTSWNCWRSPRAPVPVRTLPTAPLLRWAKAKSPSTTT